MGGVTGLGDHRDPALKKLSMGPRYVWGGGGQWSAVYNLTI